uniref:NADH-ubiquinone oxidoreductase chain 5 n=1 Tax=Sycobia sp. 2 JXW-2020 TaxID=2781669 RepID=A0A8A6UUH0_9HYME|nr:NADH dehydrogenase subunit 5 [Sycobia sp. 2 JXW-2020]
MLKYYIMGVNFMFFSLMYFSSFLMMFYNKNSLFIEWSVYILNSNSVNMFIYFDWMSMLFMFTILIISSMIMFYCCEYMSHDVYNNRFFYLMMIFILSMILLIISPNMISTMIGWDGLGLSSYCLIIYYQNYYSYNSGMLTVLLNRIGDIFIISTISLMLMMGDWNYMNLNYMDLKILLFVVIAAFTKSAQFPFSHWLPAAMAAPTPVSSLVHSSTLVTAGIYLLIRFNFLIYKNDLLLLLISIISLNTMLFAGLSALYTYDFKKIIAFSTLSQLGLMMLIYSMKEINLTFFHLVIHAMFKSMMFMCSGIFIHMMNGYQDIRFMNNSFMFLPLTSVTFMISNFSLCGFPFMSGFFSFQEFLLYNKINFYIYFMMLISTGLTVMYSMRLSYFLLNKNFSFCPYFKIYDNKIMNFSMFILLMFTIFFGYIMNWLIFMNIEYFFFSMWEKLTILMICFLFLMVLDYSYKLMFKFSKLYFMSHFLGEMWFMYKYSMNLLLYVLTFGKYWMYVYEKSWSEFIFKKTIIMESMMIKNIFKSPELSSLFLLLLLLIFSIMMY